MKQMNKLLVLAAVAVATISSCSFIERDFEKFAEGLEEVIKYIKTKCLKDGGAGEQFTDVNFEEL